MGMERGVGLECEWAVERGPCGKRPSFIGTITLDDDSKRSAYLCHFHLLPWKRAQMGEGYPPAVERLPRLADSCERVEEDGTPCEQPGMIAYRSAPDGRKEKGHAMCEVHRERYLQARTSDPESDPAGL
jgi:hypothetical protein